MFSFDVISILVSITALASYINYRHVQLPKSIGITFIALIISLTLVIGTNIGSSLFDCGNLFTDVNFNETFLHGMLSFLLFAGSMHVNVLELSRYRVLIASLATFSVLFSTFFVAFLLYSFTKLACINLPFWYCIVFGALISPTDPIAVLGILKLIKAPRSLELKVAGEALFNDGIGIVLFFVALSFAYGYSMPLTSDVVIYYFVRQGLGGLAIGFVVGLIAGLFLRHINDPDISIICTLGLVSGGYLISHSLCNVSGPICMAMAGLVICNVIHGKISDETMIRLGSFWELLDEVLNAILFVLIGLEFIGVHLNWYTISSGIAVVCITLFGRWVSILIPIYSLYRFKRVNFALLNVLTWSGLRGGVSIALALSIDGLYHTYLVGITYAVVIFSMMVQGLSVARVVRGYMRRRLYK